jgi:hypothetical protein
MILSMMPKAAMRRNGSNTDRRDETASRSYA